MALFVVADNNTLVNLDHVVKLAVVENLGALDAIPVYEVLASTETFALISLGTFDDVYKARDYALRVAAGANDEPIPAQPAAVVGSRLRFGEPEVHRG